MRKIMTQKVIVTLYQKKYTKQFNEDGSFLTTFVVQYRDEMDNSHLMSVFAYNFEPKVVPNQNCYLLEVEVYAKQNVQFNNDRLYLNLVKVNKMEPLMNPLEEIGAKEEIRQHYKREAQKDPSPLH
jgi:hypothetical protein